MKSLFIFLIINLLQLTPDNSNLYGKQKKVQVIGSSSYRGSNYTENDPKRNVNCFELAGGLSYRGFELPGLDCISLKIKTLLSLNCQ